MAFLEQFKEHLKTLIYQDHTMNDTFRNSWKFNDLTLQSGCHCQITVRGLSTESVLKQRAEESIWT
jgi:hypothetical protein